jgi:hypothetical protein
MTQAITGYRDMDAATVAAINAIKEAGNTLGDMVNMLAGDPDVDQRWLAIAKTDLQKGFMFLVRSIARPTGF